MPIECSKIPMKETRMLKKWKMQENAKHASGMGRVKFFGCGLGSVRQYFGLLRSNQIQSNQTLISTQPKIFCVIIVKMSENAKKTKNANETLYNFYGSTQNTCEIVLNTVIISTVFICVKTKHLLLLLGSVIPEILGLSINRLFDFVFGFTISIAICYLHLPQLLSEFLFLRFMTVLEYHFEHLLGHIDCCMVHKGAFIVKPDRLKQTECCLDHCNGLIKLHRTIEETFSRQLLILFGLIMGSMIFSLYLSITFIISYKNWCHSLFIFGYFLFSLVPAGRLYFLGSSVNQVIKKVDEVKQRLYMIESYSARELDVQGKVRCTIRKYSEITGFSADNYFVVNNAMVTSILGYLTTYLIVLVQFKIAE